MNQTATIPCQVEALTFEQVCARLSCGMDFLKANYDGPVSYLGKNNTMPRISSHDLRAWLDTRTGSATVAPVNPWDALTNAKSASLQERKKGKAA